MTPIYIPSPLVLYFTHPTFVLRLTHPNNFVTTTVITLFTRDTIFVISVWPADPISYIQHFTIGHQYTSHLQWNHFLKKLEQYSLLPDTITHTGINSISFSSTHSLFLLFYTQYILMMTSSIPFTRLLHTRVFLPIITLSSPHVFTSYHQRVKLRSHSIVIQKLAMLPSSDIRYLSCHYIDSNDSSPPHFSLYSYERHLLHEHTPVPQSSYSSFKLPWYNVISTPFFILRLCLPFQPFLCQHPSAYFTSQNGIILRPRYKFW